MTPFYHPTSILVLDDDPLFLESLDFQFSDELSCQTFTRPDAALDHLHSQAAQHPDFARYFKDCSEMDLGSDSRHGDRLLRLQLSELRSMVDDRSRHQRVSVAVVDYDMPKMTGVEFCRAIHDLPVAPLFDRDRSRFQGLHLPGQGLYAWWPPGIDREEPVQRLLVE
jgi:CheY-like chemotaxis protein